MIIYDLDGINHDLFAETKDVLKDIKIIMHGEGQSVGS